MSSKDIFSVVGLDKSNRHRDIPERDKIVKYLKGKWITWNQSNKRPIRRIVSYDTKETDRGPVSEADYTKQMKAGMKN